MEFIRFQTMRKFFLTLLSLQFYLAYSAFVPMQYGNYIYEGDVRTVQCFQTESGFNLPIAPLGTMNSLSIEFDRLTSEQDYFQYTLIHCDYQWNKTQGLTKNMTIDGIMYEDIPDPSFSNSVLTQYTHYKFSFPTADVKPKVSGNYLLVVYRNYDPTDVVITRRVMIYDTKGNIDMSIQQSPMVETRRTHQQVTFTFDNNQGYLIPRPYQELYTVVMQNTDWNTAIYDLKPQFISGSQFKYGQNTGNLFSGINEYRYFDMRSLIGSAANVKDRYTINGQRHVDLIQDQSRKFDNYLRWADYNGRYLINNRDLPSIGTNKTGSDYVFAHFSLKSDEIEDRRVYLYGEFSDWRIQPMFECFYNEEKEQYEAIVQLKQAFYNYQYVLVDEDDTMDYTWFEGSQSQTENNYTVFVYHKNQTLGYHEMIGYGLGNSQPER